MSNTWLPPIARLAQGCAAWLCTPQPRSGSSWGTADADRRRSRADIDAVRARFGDHA